MRQVQASINSVETNGLVVVIATGGTIAQDGGRTATVDAQSLLAASGAVGPIEAIQHLQVTSPNIGTEDWISLATLLQKVIERPDVAGVVITHGTDTLEETAFFLDLTCRSDIPVVIVGAMRPSNAPDSDGELNLRDGIALARSPLARECGVVAFLNGRVQAARDVTKRHSHKLDAFDSPNIGDLGTWEEGSALSLRTLPRLPLFPIPASLPDVPIIYSYVGLDQDSLTYLKSKRPGGLVFAGTGGGSIPDALLPLLTALAAEGTLIVRSSRTGAGPVERNVEVDDEATGLIAARHLNPQKSRILLMLCVGSGLKAAQTQSAFDQCDLALHPILGSPE
ncbi:asparaginase [Rhizobium rhizogenes]|uniref:asparaginase n=1 Tax=Rhizobium rhizogenes TaxID=359 RepID=UPI0015724B40|nr:asparaginase [Rhizobium rhizogenes]NTH22825.1 asparaginase [Rhizobium rhizogenes]NTH35855.1 asparaginase [Rhizobium rhizogenes]